MPLSEYEQRVLEQLERDLGADPKLGQAMSKATRRRGRWTWSVLGVLVGLGIVVAGAVAQAPVVGIAGFALMLAAALWGLLATGKPGAVGSVAKPGAPAPKRNSSFMTRLEERFDRRREQGDI